LEKLAPAAREVVGVLSDLEDEWRSVTKSIQQKLFEGLADDLSAVAKTWLPLLDKGLGKVAGGFNSVAKSAAEALTQSAVIEGFNAVVDNTAKGLQNFSRGVAPWLEGIGVLLSAFAPLLAEAGTWAANLGERFRDFIIEAEATGRIAEYIEQMKDTLSTLAGIAGNVGSILGSVFSATAESGGGLLGTIEDLTGRLADFLDSAEGSKALNSFFTALAAVGAAVVPVVLALAEAFGDDLAPQIGEIATGVGPALADLVTAIGDAIGNIDVATLAAGFADVLNAIVPLVGPLGEFLSWVSSIEGLVPVVVIALAAWTVAQWALNAAMYANPIVWIIGLVIALIAVFVLVAMNWEQISAVIVIYWELLKAKASEIWTSIKDFFVGIWDSIVSYAQTKIAEFLAVVGWIGRLPQMVASWLTDMITRATERFQAFVSAANQKIDGVLNAIQRMGGIPGKVAGFIQAAKDAAVAKFNSIVEFVRSVPGRIEDALGDLGGLLKDAGRDIIQGLLDGLDSMIDSVQDKLSSLTGMIPDWKGPEAVDKKLLFKPGTWVIGGLIEGLDSMIPQVQRTLQGLTTDIGLQVDGAAAPNGSTMRVDAVTSLSDEDRALLRELAEARNQMDIRLGANLRAEEIRENAMVVS
jgi:phage-related protein